MTRRNKSIVVILVVLLGFGLAWAGLSGVGVRALMATESIPSPSMTVTIPSMTPTPATVQLADPKGKPVLIEVESAGGQTLVKAKIKPTYLTKAAELDPPSGVAGWYAEPTWPVPGALSNQRSVLAGHDAMRGKADVFYDLPKAKAGDTIKVAFDSGDVAVFRVLADAVSVSKGAAVDLEKNRHVWYAPTGVKERVISLITCDLAAKHVGGSSVNNVIVQAERVS